MNVYNGTEIRKVEIALKFGQNALPQRAPNETAISNTQQSLSKQGKKTHFYNFIHKANCTEIGGKVGRSLFRFARGGVGGGACRRLYHRTRLSILPRFASCPFLLHCLLTQPCQSRSYQGIRLAGINFFVFFL